LLHLTPIQAHAQSKKTRENVAEGFNDLPDLFAGIERYSEWFPGDDNIFEASVNFLFATLQAIEEAIRFYTSNPGMCSFREPCFVLTTLQSPD
jgi:hypothetical protein